MNSQITYKDISNYFIALSNETQSLITNLKLQKMVYYAQAWCIAVNDKPLFSDDFEAWVHGPVLPVLYADYKQFAWRPLQRDDLDMSFISDFKTKVDDKTNQVIENVIFEYFGMDGFALEKCTHLEDPWLMARNGIASDEPCNNVITKQSMKDFYTPFVINEE